MIVPVNPVILGRGKSVWVGTSRSGSGQVGLGRGKSGLAVLSCSITCGGLGCCLW